MRPLKVILALLIGSILSVRSVAATCTAQVNGGLWNTAATWSCGHVPTDNDFVIIPAGFTVNVDVVTPVLDNVTIWVYGTLFFQSGQKIRLACNSAIVIFSGGSIAAASNGSKIEYCGSFVWTGPGPDSGPFSYPSTALPIELTSFNATAINNNSVLVTWTTATETNNDHFVIERTLDGINFDSISYTQGAGTSSQQHAYSFTDAEPYSGTSYYRLKQVDINSLFSYSSIVAVEIGSVYPNPCVDAPAYVIVPASMKGNELSIVIRNAVGETILSKTVFVPSGNKASDTAVIFLENCSGVLTSGFYTVFLSGAGKEITSRLVIAH
jgi:hypothetical protein